MWWSDVTDHQSKLLFEGILNLQAETEEAEEPEAEGEGEGEESSGLDEREFKLRKKAGDSIALIGTGTTIMVLGALVSFFISILTILTFNWAFLLGMILSIGATVVWGLSIGPFVRTKDDKSVYEESNQWNMISIITNLAVNVFFLVLGFIAPGGLFGAFASIGYIIAGFLALPFTISGFLLGFSQKKLLNEYGGGSGDDEAAEDDTEVEEEPAEEEAPEEEAY